MRTGQEKRWNKQVDMWKLKEKKKWKEGGIKEKQEGEKVSRQRKCDGGEKKEARGKESLKRKGRGKEAGLGWREKIKE